MQPDDIRHWIQEAEREVQDLTAEIEKLQVALADARHRLALLYELLAAVVPGSGAQLHDQAANLSIAGQVEEYAVEILADYGRPMRIKDIHAEFVRRRRPLPGRGTPTNIAAHMANSPTFRRYGRGVYGLSAWGGRFPNDDREESEQEAGNREGVW